MSDDYTTESNFCCQVHTNQQQHKLVQNYIIPLFMHTLANRALHPLTTSTYYAHARGHHMHLAELERLRANETEFLFPESCFFFLSFFLIHGDTLIACAINHLHPLDQWPFNPFHIKAHYLFGIQATEHILMRFFLSDPETNKY